MAGKLNFKFNSTFSGEGRDVECRTNLSVELLKKIAETVTSCC